MVKAPWKVWKCGVGLVWQTHTSRKPAELEDQQIGYEARSPNR